MKLCIISHKIIYRDELGFWAPGGFCSYVKGFNNLFQTVYLVVPVRVFSGKCSGDRLVGENIRVVPLPDYYDKWWEICAFLHYKTISKIIRDILSKSDVVNLRASCFLTIIAYNITRKMKKPYFLSVFGDWKTLFKYVAQRGGWRVLFRYFGDIYEFFVLRKLLYNGPVFAHNKEMVSRFSKKAKWVFPCYSSTFNNNYLVRKAPKINIKPLTILMIARNLNVNKGVVFLVNAIKKLSDEKYPIRLEVIGNDDAKMIMKKNVIQESIEDLVNFNGPLPHGPTFTQKIDDASVLVVPSLSEGAPKVILEAMARGVLVIGSNTGGIPDIIEDGKNGMLFPPGDDDAIALTIKKIFKEPLKCEEMVVCALEFAQNYTVEKISLRMVEQLKKSQLIVDGNNGEMVTTEHFNNRL